MGCLAILRFWSHGCCPIPLRPRVSQFTLPRCQSFPCGGRCVNLPFADFSLKRRLRIRSTLRPVFDPIDESPLPDLLSIRFFIWAFKTVPKVFFSQLCSPPDSLSGVCSPFKSTPYPSSVVFLKTTPFHPNFFLAVFRQSTISPSFRCFFDHTCPTAASVRVIFTPCVFV